VNGKVSPHNIKSLSFTDDFSSLRNRNPKLKQLCM
jgi:hypothetical protein